MYVACTRAMDRLYFSESEGYNVQNSQAKYPSRFIREAEDCQGPLYDIEGPFRQELWNGTDGLIRALEEPERKRASLFEEGDKVHHVVFGDGEIVQENEDEGTVSVRFQGFGLRRLNPESLTLVGED